MSDPRDELLQSIDFKEVEVKEYPKIAFLCGGSPELLKPHNSTDQYFPSVRSYISQLLTAQYTDLRYQNAEDVKDWNSYSVYDDLIAFEQDIAHLCKAIVLFVESAGSIAELGSFAIIQEITEKLIVFVHSDHSGSPSFLSYGPLKRISDTHPDRVHYITWKLEQKTYNGKRVDVVQPESMTEWGPHTCNEIQSVLEGKVRLDHSSDKYKRTKEALFIHDIICLFKAINEEEIRKYFQLASHEIDKKNVQRSIFCLEKLGLIRSVTRGSKTFYTPDDPLAGRYLTLPVRFDTARLSMQLDEYYKHPAQLARREAIQSAIGGAR